MPIRIAVRVSYPETRQYDWQDALAPYVDVGAVEVAFYQTEAFLEKVHLDAVVAPFSTLPLKATTVHMAHARITGSFFSEKPLEVAFNEIDKTMTFFSVYVVMEHLEERLWEDSRYADKELVQICSLVDEQARKYWMERNREHLELIDERMEELRNNPENKDMGEGDLRDKVIEQLDKEVYPIAIERLKEEFQWTYADEGPPMTAGIVLSLIERRKACGLISLTW